MLDGAQRRSGERNFSASCAEVVSVKALIREWSACCIKAAKRALITGCPLLARFEWTEPELKAILI